MAKEKRSKAESMIFEQVLLFGMGVIIFVACFSAFSIYQSYFSAVSSNDQIEQVRDILVSSIMKLSQKGYEMESTIELDLPRTIDGKAYIIELNDESFTIALQGTKPIEKTSVFFNIGQSELLLSGRVISTSDSVLIYKKENEIIMV